MLPKLLVDSLKRDAYVMEANAFQTPEIPRSEEAFKGVFRQFFSQLEDQLKSPLTAVLAIDSLTPTTGSRDAVVLLMIHDTEYFGRTDSPQIERLSLLASSDDPASHILKFASELRSGSEVCEQIAKLPQVRANQRIILAPYLVRSTAPPPSTEYNVQLKKWAEHVNDFMYTRPFYPGVTPAPQLFADSYYTAALYLIAPQSRQAELDLDWVEALHLMFQMSWGFPTLGNKLKKIEEMQEQDRQLRDQQEQLLAHRDLLNFIRGPARQIADQVRKLGDAAGVIQRVLAPIHYTLFRELEQGAVFFDQPLKVPVEVDEGFLVERAHQFGEGHSQESFFVPAVLTRIINLHGKKHFNKTSLVKHADKLITHGLDLRMEYQGTATALRNILGLSEENGVGVVSNERFEILRDICHRPFKLAGAAFDANLCYGFFDIDPGNRPRIPCVIKPPSRPELFLQGCYSFLQPKGDGNRVSQLTSRLQVKFDQSELNGLHRSHLEMTFLGDQGYFEAIKNPSSLLEVLKHSFGTPTDGHSGDLQHAKTQLWDWATRSLIANVSDATHFGNFLGAFLLIFGTLAPIAELCSTDEGHVSFQASRPTTLDEPGVTVSLIASEAKRSVTIRCETKRSAAI
jgi:hypothetical protein